MFIAWSCKNQTSVSCVCSAATLEQFEEILGAMPVRRIHRFHPNSKKIQFANTRPSLRSQQVDKLTIHNCEDIEKVLVTKPARPPQVSTLTQRWAATGGIPPC